MNKKIKHQSMYYMFKRLEQLMVAQLIFFVTFNFKVPQIVPDLIHFKMSSKIN